MLGKLKIKINSNSKLNKPTILIHNTHTIAYIPRPISSNPHLNQQGNQSSKSQNSTTNLQATCRTGNRASTGTTHTTSGGRLHYAHGSTRSIAIHDRWGVLIHLGLGNNLRSHLSDLSRAVRYRRRTGSDCVGGGVNDRACIRIRGWVWSCGSYGGDWTNCSVKCDGLGGN